LGVSPRTAATFAGREFVPDQHRDDLLLELGQVADGRDDRVGLWEVGCGADGSAALQLGCQRVGGGGGSDEQLVAPSHHVTGDPEQPRSGLGTGRHLVALFPGQQVGFGQAVRSILRA
jgi:hypothetical protein